MTISKNNRVWTVAGAPANLAEVLRLADMEHKSPAVAVFNAEQGLRLTLARPGCAVGFNFSDA